MVHETFKTNVVKYFLRPFQRNKRLERSSLSQTINKMRLVYSAEIRGFISNFISHYYWLTDTVRNLELKISLSYHLFTGVLEMSWYSFKPFFLIIDRLHCRADAKFQCEKINLHKKINNVWYPQFMDIDVPWKQSDKLFSWYEINSSCEVEYSFFIESFRPVNASWLWNILQLVKVEKEKDCQCW